MGVFLLRVKNMTSPSFAATPVSYRRWKFSRFGDGYGPFWAFFQCACAETGEFLVPVKYLTTPSISGVPDFLYGETFAIWGRFAGILGIFSLHIRRNGGISTSGQKSDVTIVFGDPGFL